MHAKLKRSEEQDGLDIKALVNPPKFGKSKDDRVGGGGVLGKNKTWVNVANAAPSIGAEFSAHSLTSSHDTWVVVGSIV